MRKWFIGILWGLIGIGIITFVVMFWAISKGKIGYMPDIKDLQKNHRLCNRNNFSDVWPQWKQIIDGAEHVVATTNSSAMLLRMTCDGIGIALHPIAIGKKEKDLMHLSEVGIKLSHPFWIVSHKTGQNDPKIKALIEHIKEVTLQL
jgi:DNA-binding transcriptional LysR family regulator